MMKHRTPKDFEYRLHKNLLPALQRHCTDCDCTVCPYNGLDACTNYMLDLLPDRLRFYGTDLCLDFADHLELCQKFEYDTCSACKYFSDCYAEEDSTFILKDIYNHLVDLGIYSKRYNMFNYWVTWLGIIMLILAGVFIAAFVKIFISYSISIVYKIIGSAFLVFIVCIICRRAMECFNEGSKKAFYMHQDFIICRERNRSL